MPIIPQEKLEKIFGQWGTALYRKARGGDSYEFVIDAEPKSISHNHTFGEDTDDAEVLESMLSHLSQKACKRLREAGLSARTLTLTIRYTGFRHLHAFENSQRTDAVRRRRFRAFSGAVSRASRYEAQNSLAGRSFSGLTHGNEQLDLLDPERRAKLEKLTRAADTLRDRFGFGKVQFGGSLLADEPERENEQGEFHVSRSRIAAIRNAL